MDRTLRRRWLAWLPVVALICLAAASAVTKDDVIRMAKEGKTDDDIIQAIQDSGGTFNLTANDIADLRQAGVGEKVIDSMIDTGEAPPEGEVQGTEETQTQEVAPGEVPPEEVVGPGYPVYPPVWYPAYPFWYPAYYPVYDPFFPFFGGFFFSFSFVNFSGHHAVFPCDRSVIVVRDPLITNPVVGVHPRSLLVRQPTVFSTPRTRPIGTSAWAGGHPRGSVLSAPTVRRPVHGRPGHAELADPSASNRSFVRGGGAARGSSPSRLDPRAARSQGMASRLAPQASYGSPRLAQSPRATGVTGPRFSPPGAYGWPAARRAMPSAGPRYQAAPGFPGYGPRFSAPGPRFSSPGPRFSAPGPRFSSPGPRFSGPSFSSPRGMGAPRGGFSPRSGGGGGGGHGGGGHGGGHSH